MTGFVRSIAVVLLALWLPVTLHCKLEVIPSLSFLVCCQHEGSAPHQDSDCEEDGCAVVETGGYMIEDNPAIAPGLAALLASAAWNWVAEPPADYTSQFIPTSLAPPELPQFWQFHDRTALPPRAPTLVA